MAIGTAVEDESTVVPRCTFCTKPYTEVKRLVAGPGIYICDGCVALCVDIIEKSRDAGDAPPARLPEWGELDDDAMLQHVANMAVTASSIGDSLLTWVTELRRRQVTWARLGEVLGVTRQSAWERFSAATGEE
jgi:hypothetical protein